MEKNIFTLLMKPELSNIQSSALQQFMSQRFFKPIITPLPINSLISKIQVLQWPYQGIIFKQGQRINSYYFLLEGSVNLYKKTHSNEQNETNLQIIKNIDRLGLISDSFFSHSALRAYTAIAMDSSATCKGFFIEKKQFQFLCGQLIKEYKMLKSYFCNFLNLSSDRFYKVDLYQNVQFRTFYYGQEICVQDNVFIVFSGECLMSFLQNISTRKQRCFVPFKVQIGKIINYRPLLKLCQNQCFGIQNIVNSKSNQSICCSFKYVVTSQKIVCITISTDKLHYFPKQINQKLNLIHQSHLQKLKYIVSFTNVRKNPINQEKQRINCASLSQISKDFKLIQRNDNFLTLKGDSNFFLVQPKLLQIQASKRHNFPSRKDICRFRLPNLKINTQILNQRDQKTMLNKTEDLSPQVSTLKRSKMTQKEIIELRKIFCLGFDLKSKCQQQSLRFQTHEVQGQVLKQPKGYFNFTKNRKSDNKQNSCNKCQNTQKMDQKTKHKQWSYYIKLPKLY